MINIDTIYKTQYNCLNTQHTYKAQDMSNNIPITDKNKKRETLSTNQSTQRQQIGKNAYEIRADLLQLSTDILIHNHSLDTRRPFSVEDVLTMAEKLGEFVSKGGSK